MKKIKISKLDKLYFDGTRVSNGHWAIQLDACIQNFVFNEPYQFLIENKIKFVKEEKKRPMLQIPLPKLDVIMQEGDIPAKITNVAINGARIVSWEMDGEAGTVSFRPDYIDIIEDLGDYHTLSDKTHGMLSAIEGDTVLAVIMPLASTREEKISSLEPVWSAMQMELDQAEVEKEN